MTEQSYEAIRIYKANGDMHPMYVGQPRLYVIDGLHPEDAAMLQALYSRSAESVERHLEKVKRTGSGKFMQSFYIGYNHKSIADCGSTTMFVENISMLAAKALEDWPLYSGQETSTRFIDMSKQPLVDPLKTDRSGEILSAWMSFYAIHQDRVSAEVRRRYPRKNNDGENKYENAVKSRTFDICRGFLPAGVCTQLSWHTNLRQAADHLATLTWHPAAEVRVIANTLSSLLAEAYPSSGINTSQADVSSVTGGEAERLRWKEWTSRNYAYSVTATTENNLSESNTLEVSTYQFEEKIDKHLLSSYDELVSTRPRGAVLPHFLTDLGQIHARFLLDFGSFRDIQRHRNGVCRMPLLSLRHGFHPWYLEQLDDWHQKEARDLIAFLSSAISAIEDPVVRQYYIPMGFRVACDVTYGLPSAVYVAELRSTKTVHPTLRVVAHWLTSRLRSAFPQVALHSDVDADDWTLRRGQQDILARENAR